MKRLAASVVLGIYLMSLAPVFAGSPKEGGSFITASEKTNGSIISDEKDSWHKESSKSTDGKTDREYKVTEKVSSTKGGIVTLGRAKITIPAGALKEDAEISIVRLHSVAPTGEDIKNVTEGEGGYRFLPAGTKFLKEVMIELPYDSGLNNKKAALSDLYTWYYDTEAKKWIRLTRKEIKKDSCVIISTTTHFTDMINGTLTVPESQSPLDFNINSIKNLEAAKADTGMIKPEGFEAMAFGDASFSFKLPLVSGRGGLTPHIDIVYSSYGSNGMMGTGFDLRYGSVITTDTRFGLPAYDKGDTYMKDGVKLKENSGSSPSYMTYSPLKEGAFELIERFIDSSGSDYWLVTSRNGVKRYYGDKDYEPESGVAENCWTGADSTGRKKFSWYLTKEEDTYGNSITYSYIKEDNYVYPNKIRWTNSKEQAGNYTVSFKYDDSRGDRRSDGRGRFISVCGKLLTEIDTEYNGEVTKRYLFDYETNYAGASVLTKFSVSGDVSGGESEDGSYSEDYAYAFDYNQPPADGAYFADGREIAGETPLNVTNGTNNGSSSSFGGGAGVGVYCVDGRLTAGGQASATTSESYSAYSIVDINGDGRPDSVRQMGGRLFIRLGLLDENDVPYFSDGYYVSLPGVKEIDAEKGKSVSSGWNMYGGLGMKFAKDMASGNAGATYSSVEQEGSTRSECRFMDMNRDGFIDIVQSGSTTYLRNEGDGKTFTETNFYGSASTETKSVDKSEYEDDYPLQTPFRQWKAPFRGRIVIKNNAHLASSSDESIECFIVSDGNDEKKSFKAGSGTVSFEYEVKRNQSLYFISDNKDSSRKSLLDWNIEISYISLYPFDSTINALEYCQDESVLPKEASASSPSDFSEFGIDTVFEPLYDYELGGEDSSARLKSNWRSCLDKNSSEKLISLKKFIPVRVDEQEFEETMNSKASEVDAFRSLTSNYAHDFGNSEFELQYDPTSNTDVEGMTKLFHDYFSKNSLDKLYKRNGLVPVWNGKTPIYSSSMTEDNADGRSETKAGSVLDYGGRLCVGNFISTSGDCIKAKKSWYVKDLPVTVSGEIGDPEILVSYSDDHADYTVTLADFSSRTESVLEEELLSYFKKNLVSAYPELNWKLYAEPASYFETIENAGILLTEEERDNIRDLVFDEIITSVKNPDGTVTKKSSWRQKKSASLDSDSILEVLCTLANGSLFEKFLAEKFNFYEPDGSGTYSLKAFWKNKLDSEAFARMLRSGSNQEDMPATWNSYLTLNSSLEKFLAEYKIGRYKSVERSIIYKDVEYEVNGDGCYELTVLDPNGFLRKSVQSYPVADLSKKWTWNSSDFSTENKVRSVAYSYNGGKFSVLEDGLSSSENISGNLYCSVSGTDLLYGGVNQWYYGIWVGKPSEFTIPSVSRNSSYTSYSAAEAANKSKVEALDDSASRSSATKDSEKISYYAPSIPMSDCYQNAVEKETGISLTDGGSILAGSIDMNVSTSSSWTADGQREVKTSIDYDAPFITGDLIHPARMGGNSFYEITAVKTPASSFVMTSLQESESSSTDISRSASVGAEAKISSEIEQSKVLEKLESLSKSIESNGGTTSSRDTALGVNMGASKGTNKGSSDETLRVQDFNGDGIPDIIRKDGSGLSVLEGSLYGNEISYGKSPVIVAGVELGVHNNSSTVAGASLGAEGSLANSYKANGRLLYSEPVGLGVSTSADRSESKGESSQSTGLADLNGDGLMDFSSDGTVFLCAGNSFVGEKFGGIGMMSESESLSESFGLSIGLSKSHSEDLACTVSPSSGLTYSANSSSCNVMLLDLNGDGLADKVFKIKDGTSSKFYVDYNDGDGFISNTAFRIPDWNISNSDKREYREKLDGELEKNIFSGVPLVGSKISAAISSLSKNPYGDHLDLYANSLDFSSGVSVSGNVRIAGSFTFSIPIPIVWLSVNVTASTNSGLNVGASTNGASVKMIDIDGDGLPDQVLRIPGKSLSYKKNLLGGVGLLNTVRSSLGGKWKIDYSLEHSTVDMPQSRWVMSKVTVLDGCGEAGLETVAHGEHKVVTSFEYEGGMYSREEKDFFGFAKVVTRFCDSTDEPNKYGYSVATYKNSEYYLKGMEAGMVFYDENGVMLSKSSTVYDVQPYARPLEEVSASYDTDGNSMSSGTKYVYGDPWGNVTRVVQLRNGVAYVSADINYWNSTSLYLHAHPSRIAVYDAASGKLLRKREGSYNEFGSLDSVSQYYGASKCLTTGLAYDGYGNLRAVTNPAGVRTEYTYDLENRQYIVGIALRGSATSDSYKSKISYDYAHGLKKEEEDINGNRMTYEYDDLQRLVKVFSPYDGADMAAVEYEYHTFDNLSSDETGHGLWYVMTRNKISFDPDNDKVMTTVAVIDGSGRAVLTAKRGVFYDDGTKRAGWNVSGCVEYDGKARPVREYMNRFVEGEDVSSLLAELSSEGATYYTEKTYDSLDRVTRIDLPDGSCTETWYSISDGHSIVTATDENRNTSRRYSDPVGNVLRTERCDSDGNVLTSATYEYNAMGEMTAAFDSQKNAISSVYDLMGRRTELSSIDGGRQVWAYNSLGQLSWKTNSALLAAEKGNISYEYDSFGRMVRIDNPISKDVEIEYGKPGAEGNAAGKIVRRTDGTGTVEYEYGLLGEMTVEGRTIRHGLYESTALTLYQSDYLGRMEYIVYPDGETVSYGYDDGGNVCSVTGTKDGYADVEYVRDIGYDEYGQRVYIAYGNGVTTNYTYDERRRWLKNLVTESESDGQVQNIAYSFDRVGNVLGYSNSGNKEYETVQSYKYDSLYQLVEAEGTSSHIKSTADRPAFTATYRQIFSFSTDGLCNMTAKSSSQNETYEDDLNYSLDYEYEAGFVHRLARAGDRYYKYDASGNLVREQERSFDETEGSEDVTYRKVSTEDGGRNVSSVDYAWAASNDTKNASVKDMYYWREFTWNEDNMLIQTRDNDYITTYLYGQDNQRAVKSSAQSETFYFNKFFTHRFDDSDNWAAGRMSKHIYLGSDRIVTKVSMLTRLDYEADDTEAEASHTYYYHSDHLGSAQTITNCDGDLYERLEYTPYGEVWLDEGGDYVRTEDTFSTPYRFTGKERDEETGLYYYGARYLDSKYSRWISTDPALGEYIPQAPVSDEAKKHNQNLPGMGGVFNHINGNLYHYAGNNPIRYIDPDGRELWGWLRGTKVGWNDNAPQTRAGYYNWMDTASIALFDIDHAELEMGDYTIRFWKGDYGSTARVVTQFTIFSPFIGMAGGEVGLYNNDGKGLGFGNDGGSLMSSSDLDKLGITNVWLNIKNQNGKDIASVDGKRAWSNVYSLFNHSKKSDIYTETTFAFGTRKQASAFAKEFIENKANTKYDSELKVRIFEKYVTITWGKNDE